jgi:hypothetical protein
MLGRLLMQALVTKLLKNSA